MGNRDSDLLSLVIVTHNSDQWLPGFFSTWQTTITNCPGMASQNMSIVITDSGSGQQSIELIKQLATAAQVIQAGHVGYGAAANRAIEKIQSRWILLCNPDLTFPPDFASKFLQPLLSESPPAWLEQTAVIAPRLLNPDGSVQPSIGRFPSIGQLVRDQFRSRDRRKYIFPQPKEATAVEWANGACLLIRRDRFVKIGGFDPRFFLYVEEVDLQKRFQEAGDGRWFWLGEVYHHAPNANRTPRPQVQRWAARGLLRYFAKHGKQWQLGLCRLLIFVSGRLPPGDVFRSRQAILSRPTGPD